ncbi:MULTISPECIES: ABC transporter ATP-binding protein [unclassified Solwaraspora]|uniref:ABC transporter ATP-binding protein n=1 Tax=unclassified Solwaraspora TaxID=2627926 RepID=UPI00259B0ECD|nr:ABC transporter ATP-binding protein [Solwaraspora sp. WMMA2056]WJK38550.1 ABC transporter ATP-binding protein [Solwaraspora sp. WMMA2056]
MTAASTTTRPLLEVDGLTVSVGSGRDTVHLVEQVDLSVAAGETLGLVGESGSGKSITCLALAGLLPPGARITGGSIRFAGQELTGRSPAELTRFRGNRVGMVFQEALSSLNPAFTVGNQIVESLLRHTGMNRRQARARAVELLDLVRIPDPQQRVASYPHELSGGMAQRALIAMAIAGEPELLIADEPTTALDVTVQLQILQLLGDLRDALGMSLLLVSHDLGVIATMAQRLSVMYAGQVVESGPVRDVFAAPRHPYTSALISSSAEVAEKATRLPVIPGQVPRPGHFPAAGCRFANRCAHAQPQWTRTDPPWTVLDGGDRGTRCGRQAELELPGAGPAPATESGPPAAAEAVADATVEDAGTAGPTDDSDPTGAGDTGDAGDGAVLRLRGLGKQFPLRRGVLGLRRVVVHAVDGVDLTVARGRTLGLVGESGSGKSTVGRLALRLIEPSSGEVSFLGRDLAAMSRGELRSHRRGMQMVFQDPYASLDPSMTVGQSIAEPLVVHSRLTPAERRSRIGRLLERVGLDPSLARRSPRSLSGGQRQRISFARALALEPQLIICDEPVSALDVSTRSQIVNLVQDIQEAEGIAFLFIAHDLALVHHVSHELAVMYLGRVVESGPASRVYSHPAHPYTQALLASMLTPASHGLADRSTPTGEIPSPIDPPSGCRFRTRCPHAMPLCAAETPQPTPVAGGGWSACHLTG